MKKHVVFFSSGFSLIELLIVVTLTVMIIVSASSVLLTALLSNGKVNTTKTIKQNGDYAMSQMTVLLRNAVKVIPNSAGQTCSTGMDELRFQSFDEGTTTLAREVLSASDARIASNSGIYLTSDSVYLTDSLQFDCRKSADGLITNITISFTLSKGTPGISRVTEYGTEDFRGSVTIRSF